MLGTERPAVDRELIARPAPGRIGPNAIVRTVEALRERVGAGAAGSLLREAGLGRCGEPFPDQLVAETEVTALFGALHRSLAENDARAVARRAGERTADYLLAHRIPRVAQLVLPRLPSWMASRGLLSAMRGSAWTFAGSSEFTARDGRPAVLTFRRCPFCRDLRARAPVCDYYAGTFERLYRELVARGARVRETACTATGGSVCVFEVRY